MKHLIKWPKNSVIRGNTNTFRNLSTISSSHLIKYQPNFSQIFHRNYSVLSTEHMNQAIKKVHYAVRGPIVDRALELEYDLSHGLNDHPFNEVIKCNIGDAHAMGQQPITLIRQVIAGMLNPSSISTYPEDVQKRINYLLKDCGGSSIGAYTHSAGLPIVRQHIAQYITERDGQTQCDPNEIFLSTGASGAIVQVLKLLTYGKHGRDRSGIMIPTPQYPLYSATISELEATRVNYFLSEDTNWSLGVDELERSYQEATKFCSPRVLCIINPGNPTGNVLSKENIKGIVKFAYDHDLFVMSDEVYQDNVYAEDCKFHSFRKVLLEMGEPYKSELVYASFHSISKGYMGECGLRGGYMQLGNWAPAVIAQMSKLLSARLCPPVTAQAAMDCVSNTPKIGDESFELWNNEKNTVLKSLKEKAKLTATGFNNIEGISCQTVQGAMYSFPNIEMPEKFLKNCEINGSVPDAVYCMTLLEQTGVCVVPGSGFGQKQGTFHCRMTILPPADKMKIVLEKFSSFHKSFCDSWK